MLLPHPAAARRPLQLLASPLPLEARQRSGADLMIAVTDPNSRNTFPDNDLYALTPSETEIANGLLMGYALGEIASLRQVSPGTVRNQLKAVMRKTDTRRQSELVTLLATLPRS